MLTTINDLGCVENNAMEMQDQERLYLEYGAEIIEAPGTVDALRRAGRLRAALSAIEDVILAYPNSPDFIHTKAEIKNQMGDTKGGRDIFMEIVKKWPSHVKSYRNLEKYIRENPSDFKAEKVVNEWRANFPRKLHIGGQKESPEWEILDAIKSPIVDHVGDAKDLSQFANNTFAELYASHVLEHFDHRGKVVLVLKEWRRVLKPGGKLYVSVPDLDKIAELFLTRHKYSFQDRKWLIRMIFGGHINKFDYHYSGFNREILEDYLKKAGFVNMKQVDDLGYFADTSKMKFHGVAISINIVSEKQNPKL